MLHRKWHSTAESTQCGSLIATATMIGGSSFAAMKAPEKLATYSTALGASCNSTMRHTLTHPKHPSKFQIVVIKEPRPSLMIHHSKNFMPPLQICSLDLSWLCACETVTADQIFVWLIHMEIFTPYRHDQLMTVVCASLSIPQLTLLASPISLAVV